MSTDSILQADNLVLALLQGAVPERSAEINSIWNRIASILGQTKTNPLLILSASQRPLCYSTNLSTYYLQLKE